MERLAIQKKHMRQVYIRKVVVASIVGAFLSFFVGASALPWLWAVVLLGIHQFPQWHQPGSFPNPLYFIATPNVLLGLGWLLYYLVTFVWAMMTLSARQKAQIRAEIDQKYRQPKDFSDSHSQKQQAPLSEAWPGELKYELVERCYQEYRQALQRYNSPPIDLRTPSRFYYRKGGQLEWIGSMPVLPEHLLTPERIHELLPFLAHHLAYYNSDAPKPDDLNDYPDHVPLAWLLIPTGNFLWLPVKFKHGLEEQLRVDEVAQKKQQVHEADAFAVLLGQGPALEHQLRRMDEEPKQRRQIDRGIPTLSERLGHLEALNKQEREQMRKLGLKPKEPPLVKGDTPRQPGDGMNE